MADPLVNFVPNVDNNIAYDRNDQKSLPGRPRNSAHRVSEAPHEADSDSESLSDEPADPESGVGLNVNREV